MLCINSGTRSARSARFAHAVVFEFVCCCVADCMVNYRGRWRPECDALAEYMRTRLGMSDAAVADELGVNIKTVQYHKHLGTQPRPPRPTPAQVIKRRKLLEKLRKATVTHENFRYTPKLRKERSRKTTALRFPTCSALAVALNQRGIKVSKETVRRDLVSMGCKAHKYRRTPFLTDKQKKDRVEFCKWALKNKPKLCFTDEAWIDGNHNSGHYWRKKNEPERRRRVDKYGYKVLIWALICPGVRKVITVTTHNGALDATRYKRDVLSKAKAEMRKANRLGYLIQEDNASPHKAAQWFKKNRIQTLGDLGVRFPPNSCDIALIENSFGHTKYNVRRRYPYGVEEIARYAEEEFMALPEQEVEKMFAGWEQRLRDVIKCGGDSIRPSRRKAEAKVAVKRRRARRG